MTKRGAIPAAPCRSGRNSTAARRMRYASLPNLGAVKVRNLELGITVEFAAGFRAGSFGVPCALGAVAAGGAAAQSGNESGGDVIDASRGDR